MKPYHKIPTVWKRDPATKFVIEGQYAIPELAYLAHNPWLWTEKVNGRNIRVMWREAPVVADITFAGRTDDAQTPTTLRDCLTAMFTERLPMFSVIFDGPVCLYGEGYGPGATKGSGKYADAPNFVLFDVQIDGWWLERHNVEDIAQKLDLRVVPILNVGSLPEMIDYVRGGFKSTWGDFTAEGIVAQPATPLVARSGQRIITKLKCSDFLKTT